LAQHEQAEEPEMEGERTPLTGAAQRGGATDARSWRGVASCPALAVAAVHALCVAVTALVVTWMSQYHGFSWAYGDAGVFSWHPTLMTLALLVCLPQAAIAFRWMTWLPRSQRKTVHGALLTAGLALASVGLVAVVRFHDEKQPTRIKNFYSLHSIVGLLTLCLLVAQWLGGLYAFWWPQVVGESRALFRAVHARVGLVLALGLVLASVLSGVAEKTAFTASDCTGGNATLEARCRTGNAFGGSAVFLILNVALVLLWPAAAPTAGSDPLL
jgi:hypothetical protein